MKHLQAYDTEDDYPVGIEEVGNAERETQEYADHASPVDMLAFLFRVFRSCLRVSNSQSHGPRDRTAYCIRIWHIARLRWVLWLRLRGIITIGVRIARVEGARIVRLRCGRHEGKKR